MRKALAGSLCLVLGACFSSEAAEPPAIDLTQMEPLVREAIGDGIAAVQEKPRSAATWGKLGAVLEAHQRLGEASSCYQRASRLEPEEFGYRYRLALTRERAGAPLEVTIPLFQAAASLKPTYPPLFLRMGDSYARQGRLAEAREAYGQALERDEHYGAAHLGMAQVLLGLGEAELALSHLEQAALEASEDRAVNVALARALTMTGNLERAQEHALASRTQRNELRAKDSTEETVHALAVNSEAFFQRGVMTLEAGYHSEAIGYFEEVLSANPGQPDARALLANAHLNRGQQTLLKGQPNLAVPDFERSLELAPEQWHAQERLGTAFFQLGRLPEARGRAQRAIGLDPQQITPHLLMARILIQSKEPVQAERAIEQALLVEPGHSDVLELKGVFLVQSGRLDEAIAQFEDLAKNDQLAAPGQVMWAAALVQLERVPEAVEHFRAAVEAEPDVAAYRYNLGLALEQTGETAQAIEEYQEALSIDPRHQQATLRLQALRTQ